MGKYESKNAAAVLEQVERYLENIDGQHRRRYTMREVYDNLSIFDWWVDYMSKTKLEEMRRFLKAAIERGYTGYACFKVGATGCANGMWAHKAESEDGYSPDGEFIYKSFTPEYTCWSVMAADGVMYPNDETGGWNSCKTAKQLDKLIEEVA